MFLLVLIQYRHHVHIRVDTVTSHNPIDINTVLLPCSYRCLYSMLLFSAPSLQQPFLHTPADGITPCKRNPGPLVDWWPTSTGAVHKSGTCSCVFMLLQLNKCVVCGSDLQTRHSGDGCLTSSILFKYERSRGHLFVMSWARVRRVARRSVVLE